MTLQVSLFDDKTQSIAKVNPNGGLIVAPSHYSTAYYVLVDTAATTFEVIPAISDMNFIVTGMLIASDKSFATSTVAETLTIYEANPADLSVNTKTITQIDLLRNDRLVATALDLATTKTKTLVAIATSANVNVTLSGYYIDVQ